MSMLNYMQAYCNVNDIEQVTQLMTLAAQLEQSPKSSVIGLSRLSYIIYWFQELMQEKISVDQFMTMGDVSAEHMVTMPVLPQDATGYMDTLLVLQPKTLHNALVLLDKVALVKAEIGRQQKIEGELAKINAELHLL